MGSGWPLTGTLKQVEWGLRIDSSSSRNTELFRFENEKKPPRVIILLRSPLGADGIDIRAGRGQYLTIYHIVSSSSSRRILRFSCGRTRRNQRSRRCGRAERERFADRGGREHAEGKMCEKQRVEQFVRRNFGKDASRQWSGRSQPPVGNARPNAQ